MPFQYGTPAEPGELPWTLATLFEMVAQRSAPEDVQRRLGANDACRLQSRPAAARPGTLMASFRRFDDDSEHDWGVFIFAGYSFEWRIEYRGSNGIGLSSDPADPEKTFRVLTLYVAEGLLAEEDSRPDRSDRSDAQSGGMTPSAHRTKSHCTAP
jgi:hypothetical protein